MSKRKNWASQLASERYFVWAVVFVIVIGGGVLTQIALANAEFDSEAASTSLQGMPHKTFVQGIHKK